MDVRRLTQREARQVAVRAQLLDAERPEDLMQVLRGLKVVQHDPVSAVAPSAHLVLWSRLGSTYSPLELEDAIAEQRVVELHGCYRPIEDVALHRAEMDAWPNGNDGWQAAQEQWVRDNDACRHDILDRLRSDGPLPARELPDTTVRPWRSSGWNDKKNVPMLLDLLVSRGEVAVAGRGGPGGRHKLYDLASRVYPDDDCPDLDTAARRRDERRLQALGIARASGTAVQGEPHVVGGAGVAAVVDGVRGTWRVDPEQLDRDFSGRTALLSPLDRLVMDRARMTELFEFDYTLEMYKPQARRRWGYYALPILYGDRLVGKLDAIADRSAGELLVHAVHEDHRWEDEVRASVDAEIDDLGRWLDLDVVRHQGLEPRTR